MYRTTGNMLFNYVYLWYTLTPSIRLMSFKIYRWKALAALEVNALYRIWFQMRSRFIPYDGKVVSIDAWHFVQYNAILFWDKNHCFYLTIAYPYLTDTYAQILYKEGLMLIGYHLSTDPWTVSLDNWLQWGNLFYCYCALWLSPPLHL